MEGFLDCKIGYSISRYYFIIHESILLYCKKKSGRVIGQLHLQIAKIELNDCQINISTGIETIKLLYKNNQERNIWFDYLSKSNQQVHIEDELAKIISLQQLFDTTLKQMNKIISPNPNLNSYSEKLQLNGFKFIEKLNELAEILHQQKQPEFHSCESINSLHTESLKPVPIIKKAKILRQPIYNIWGNVKNQLNKQYYDMRLPVYSYLPCTMIQLISTQIKYINILERASYIRDQDFKIALLIGFLASQYSNIQIKLPLPSVINETFELIDFYKYLSQQVTPNIVAFHCTSINFDYFGQIEYEFQLDQLNFDINIKKQFTVIFKKTSQEFKVISKEHILRVKNLVSLQPEIQVNGEFIIESQDNKFIIRFDNNQISGQIGLLQITGTLEKPIASNIYNEELILYQYDNKECDFNKHYPLLPPSDSRFRIDLIKILEGNYYIAQQIIDKFDFSQSFQQVWFNKTNENYIYKGGYFTNQQMN